MTNASAVGYMILALRSLGYTKEQIDTAERAMKIKMDMITEEAAAETYRCS